MHFKCRYRCVTNSTNSLSLHFTGWQLEFSFEEPTPGTSNENNSLATAVSYPVETPQRTTTVDLLPNFVRRIYVDTNTTDCVGCREGSCGGEDLGEGRGVEERN